MISFPMTMIVGTQLLRELVNIANAMKEKDLTFRPDAEGYTVLIAPPANIERMAIRIPADAIRGFEGGDAFAVAADRLSKVLMACGDEVEMTVTDRVTLKSGRMRCTLPLVACGEPPRIPPLDGFTSECVVSSDIVRQVSDAAPENAQGVHFVLTENGLTMTSAADDGVTETVMEIPADECVMCEGAANALFTWECWRTFLKGLPRGNDIDMRMADDYPLIVRFVTSGGLDGTWMLAPWIAGE